MAIDLSLGNVLNFASGVLLLALGVFVARVRHRRRGNLAFAVFSISMGLAFTVQNTVTVDDPLWLAVNVVGWSLTVPGALALPAMAAWLPRPLKPAQRRLAVASVAMGAGVVVLAIAGILAHIEALRTLVYQNAPPGLAGTFFEGTRWILPFAFFLQGMFIAALLLFALRYAAARPPERRQIALMSGALGLYPGLIAGIYAAFPPIIRESGALVTAGFVGVAVVWLGNTRVPERADAKAARSLALLLVAIPLLGLVVTPLVGGGPLALSLGITGTARTLTVVVLAYAILRHQLLGLDVKVKWTVRRGTLAAVFIGVFLVVTQVAQNYLSQYGVLAGGIAAGVLLFALTPLQRFAERVADTAMPDVKAVSEMSGAERLAVYRDAAVQAWEDGTLDRSERALLDRLQKSLRLRPEEAMRVEQDAARSA